ncbi:G-protein beta WD-40 repeat [Gracilaria domingensis]|nr:G-protein beta WD-40 repeat [Gracilaria domingensis]
MPVEHVCPELSDNAVRDAVTEEVRQAVYRIVDGKPEGSSKGIGECLADLTQSLLTGIGNIRTVCTRVTSQHIGGLKEAVFMSVPCKIDSGGVAGIFPFEVDERERQQLMEAAGALAEAQKVADGVLAEGDLYQGVVSVALPRAALRSVRSLPVT